MTKIGLRLSLISIFFLWMFLVKLENLGMKGALMHTSLNLGLLIVLFHVHGRYLVNTFLESKKYFHFAIGSIVVVAVYILLRLYVIYPLLESYYPENSRFSAENVPYLYGFLSISVLTFSTLVHLLENRYQKEKTSQLIIQEHQAAQLQFLKAQINPHFLFNTLNNIYSLSIAQSSKTPEMVLQLSQLLRYVIYESQNQKVSLSGELEQIEKYIDLFQLKHEHPVDIALLKEGIINGQLIEPMMLIPLVENALKHCDFDTNDNAYAKIQIKMDGETLHFRSINSKNNLRQQKDEVGGVGLQNIKKRLALNYPQNHELLINNAEHSFEVILNITLTQ